MAYVKVSRFRSFINKVTGNIDYKIELLFHENKEVSKRAFRSLLAYSNDSKKNVALLCDKKIVPILVELMKLVDLDNLTLVLQNLFMIMSRNLEAVLQFMNIDNLDTILEINAMFMSSEDDAIRQICSYLLRFTKINDAVIFHLLSTDVMGQIFDQLENTDIETGRLLGLLEFLDALFSGSNAKDIVAKVGYPRLKILFVHIKVPLLIVKYNILHIISFIFCWKDIDAFKLLSQAEIMEDMFNVITDDTYDGFRNMVLKMINMYRVSEDMSTYCFIWSDEFKLFCRWLKTCNREYIDAGATFINNLISASCVREILIENSIHDTILSLLRSKEPINFYTNCDLISKLLKSEHCPSQIISDKVVVYVLNTLKIYDLDVPAVHQIALKVLCRLLSNTKSVPILIKHRGVAIICNCILRNFIQFTTYGLILTMQLLNIFLTTRIISFVLSRKIYEIVVMCFDSPSSELSKLALKIIQMHLYDEDCQNYFLEFDGPIIVEKKLLLIDTTDVFRAVLRFLDNLLSIDNLRAAMIQKTEFLKILKSYDKEVAKRFPKIRRSLTEVCNFHWILRFHTYGHLPPENVCDYKFYVINNKGDFCFMEHLLDIKASPYFTMYVVDFRDPSSLAQLAEILDAVEEPAASVVTTGRPHTFFTNLFRRVTHRNLRDTHIQVHAHQESPTIPVVPIQNVTQRKIVSYIDQRQYINYGTLSPDPYLQEYLNILRKQLVNCDRIQRVPKIARFVAEVIQHPQPGVFKHHINCLKNLLGTNMIPIGYLRFGYGCERSLLFKALADKLDVPASLVRQLSTTTKLYSYWNEVFYEGEKYIVDLLHNVGRLMKSGSFECFEYCSVKKRI